MEIDGALETGLGQGLEETPVVPAGACPYAPPGSFVVTLSPPHAAGRHVVVASLPPARGAAERQTANLWFLVE